MKKVLMCLFLACGVLCATPLKADLAEMAAIMKEELTLHTALTVSKEKSVETYVIKYGTAEDGSHMHFGIWTDCIIGTVVGNAPNIGTQIIMLVDGSIFDSSANYKKHKDYFVNKYSWGTIKSYDHKQIISSK